MRMTSWLVWLGMRTKGRCRGVRREKSWALAAQRLEDRTLLAAFVVNTTLDTPDANPGDGLAQDSSGNTSLRAAVMEANALNGDDTIRLPAGTYLFSQVGRDEDAAVTGDLDVTDVTGSLTITGAGGVTTIVDANEHDRVFDVHSGGDLHLIGMQITNGNADTASGGAIRVRVDAENTASALTVTDSIITANRTNGVGGAVSIAAAAANTSVDVRIENSTLSNNFSDSQGGAIFNQAYGWFGEAVARVVVVDSRIIGNSGHSGGGIRSRANAGSLATAIVEIIDTTISENHAENSGGGVSTDAGHGAESSVFVLGSTIANNRAEGANSRYGGGIYNDEGNLTISNSTISGNSLVGETGSTAKGGGVYATGPGILLISNSTIVNNSVVGTDADGFGGGVWFNTETAEITNSIIAGNTADKRPDLNLPEWTIERSNIIGDTDGVARFDASDIVNVDPLLGRLQDNGGATETHMPLEGSPAIDAGNTAEAPADDQRGVARPQGASADIGAVEVVVASPTPIIPTGGGTFELLLDTSDIVLRRPGGEELYRNPLASTPELTLTGSSDADMLHVDLSGGTLPAGFALTINADGGNDIVNLLGLPPDFDGTITINGQTGDDLLDASALSYPVTLDGGAGNDTLIGGTSDDLLLGNADADRINGRRGRDTIEGGPGNDKMFGGGGRDSIDGGPGNDKMRGHGSRDTLRGGDGDDTLLGGAARDRVVEWGDADFTLTDESLTGRGNDRLGGIEQAELTGGHGDNTLDARDFSGRVTLSGGGGADSLVGGSNRDYLDGGHGNDTLNGGAGKDGLFGGDGDDAISGMAGDDKLVGGRGHDTMLGGEGNDKLRGQVGNDIALGENGVDNVNGNNGTDTVAGGGNGIAADVNDTVVGETVDDAFVFDAAWVNV